MDYQKLSFRELRRALNTAHPTMPHYVKAKEEHDRRLKVITLILGAVGLSLTIVWHYLSN